MVREVDLVLDVLFSTEIFRLAALPFISALEVFFLGKTTTPAEISRLELEEARRVESETSTSDRTLEHKYGHDLVSPKASRMPDGVLYRDAFLP